MALRCSRPSRRSPTPERLTWNISNEARCWKRHRRRRHLRLVARRPRRGPLPRPFARSACRTADGSRKRRPDGPCQLHRQHTAPDLHRHGPSLQRRVQQPIPRSDWAMKICFAPLAMTARALAVAAALLLPAAAHAGVTTFTITQGTGTTFDAFTDGSGNLYGASGLYGISGDYQVDVTSGHALLTTIYQGTTALSSTNGLYVLPTTAATWAATESGTWTVQPGNTANTTAWLVTGTGGTFPATESGTWNITNISGTISLPTGAATAANQTNGSQTTQIVGVSGTPTQTTASVTTSSSTILAASTATSFIKLCVASTAANGIWVNWAGAAATQAAPSEYIVPGQCDSWVKSTGYLPTSAITAIA